MSVLFSTSIDGFCQRCLTFPWTPFLLWILLVVRSPGCPCAVAFSFLMDDQREGWFVQQV